MREPRTPTQAPTAWSCGEAHVLASLADGEAELVVAYDDGCASELEAEADLLYLGGLERVLDEDLAGLVPPDDVYFLAVELVHDVADARAAYAHTGADCVDLGVDGGDGDLGAVAGLAGHGLDLDDPLGDLGDLDLEELSDEIGVGP